MTQYNNKIIAEFRANHGVVGGRFKGIKLLLLHNIGAKSGELRVNPLAYFNDGDDLLVVASYSGADKNPPWYFNLLAEPQVTVEVLDKKYEAVAHDVSEPERSELYNKIASVSSAFAEYQGKTTRVIPVIRLVQAR